MNWLEVQPGHATLSVAGSNFAQPGERRFAELTNRASYAIQLAQRYRACRQFSSLNQGPGH